MKITPNPTASFAPTIIEGCAPLEVSFDNNSFGASFYEWNFGDSGTSNLESPNHTFLSPGLYTVSLKAMDSNGCFTDTSFTQINVFDVPESSFTTDKEIYCLSIEATFFNNTSQRGDAYFWDFGNGITSDLESPELLYDLPGQYEVVLITSNAFWL